MSETGDEKTMTERSILVVEDELIVALEIKKTLIKLGYRVAGTEKDGQSAIETAGKTSPDLVLMDIRLKGEMDGIEAAQRIRALYQTPVIFLTAHSDEDTLSRALKTQPCGYLVKPFRERELYQAIEMCIHKNHVLKKIESGRTAAKPAPSHPLEAIEVPALLLRDDGKISVVNRAFTALTGLSPKECFGRTFATVIGLETGEHSQILPDQMVVRTHDGSRRRVMLNVGFVTTTGRPQPLITFTPEGASASAAVAGSDFADYRQILDALEIPVLVIGDDLRIRFFNTPLGTLLSRLRISQFLLSRPIYEVEKLTVFGSVDDFRDVMGTRTARSRVRRLCRKDADDLIYRFVYIPMVAGGKDVVTMLIYDVTAEVKNTEDRAVLSQAHFDLQDILDEVFAISSELKQPVTSLEHVVRSRTGTPGMAQVEEGVLKIASVIGRMDSALLRFDDVKEDIDTVAKPKTNTPGEN